MGNSPFDTLFKMNVHLDNISKIMRTYESLSSNKYLESQKRLFDSFPTNKTIENIYFTKPLSKDILKLFNNDLSAAALKFQKLGNTDYFKEWTINSRAFNNNELYVFNKKVDWLNLYSNVDLTESSKVLEELSEEIEVERTEIKEYSEEQLQVLDDALSMWVQGKMSMRKLVDYFKEHQIQGAFILFLLNHIFQILVIVGYQIEHDQPVVKVVQEYVKEEVYPFNLYIKYMKKEKLSTVNDLGLTRKPVQMREGRCKTAPIVSHGKLKEKTVVYMYEAKNGWRKVEIKINETFVKGWIPESSVNRLKQGQLEHY